MTNEAHRALLDLVGIAVIFVALSVMFSNQRPALERSWQVMLGTTLAAIACLLISAFFVLSSIGHGA